MVDTYSYAPATVDGPWLPVRIVAKWYLLIQCTEINAIRNLGAQLRVLVTMDHSEV